MVSVELLKEINEKIVLVGFFKVEPLHIRYYYEMVYNEKLKELLINTGDRVIYEASPHDSFFGVGLSLRDRNFWQKVKDHKGQNHLGRILMNVREILKQGNG